MRSGGGTSLGGKAYVRKRIGPCLHLELSLGTGAAEDEAGKGSAEHERRRRRDAGVRDAGGDLSLQLMELKFPAKPQIQE